MVRAGKRRALVIVNPKAGSYVDEKLRSLVDTEFVAAGWHYALAEIGTHRQMAEAIASAEREGVSLVVAVGGDGTVAAVAHHLVGKSLTLGILPAGTDNMLARDLGIPPDLSLGAALLAGDHATATLDALKIGDRYYFLNGEIGLGATVMQETPPEQKKRLGMLAYAATFVGKVLNYRPRRFSITVDGVSSQVSGDGALVANAGLMRPLGPEWASQISATDGELDLVVWRTRGIGGFLRLAWDIFQGVERSPVLLHGRVRRSVRIVPDRALPAQADGEALDLPELLIEVVPAAVRVAVPLDEGEQRPFDPAKQPEQQRRRARRRLSVLRRQLGPVGELDTSLFLLVNSLPHPPALDFAMRLLSALMNKGLAWAAALEIVARLDGAPGRRAAREVVPAMWLAGMTVELVVKRLFGRMRPFRALALSSVVGAKPTGYSFPSAHSAVAFAAAQLTSAHYPRWAAPLYGLAALVGFSRLYLGVHYASDVLVGALSGLLLAPVARGIVRRLRASRRQGP